MAEQFCGITIPEDFKNILPSHSKPELHNMNEAEIIRDNDGNINRVNYYSNDGASKQVYYNGDYISEIRYFYDGILYKKQIYKDEKLVTEYFYKKTGELSYCLEYEYKLHKISALTRTYGFNKRRVELNYDQFDRISERTILVNNINFLTQYYSYDALDRIIGYRDDNYRVFVEQFTRNNELQTYKITDKMNNIVVVNNRFDENYYTETELTVNNKTIIVKNKNYVDNVMIKKPTQNMDDLDLILSNLYNQKQEFNCTRRTSAKLDERLNSGVANLIEFKSNTKVLPLALRKRLLYQQSLKIND